MIKTFEEFNGEMLCESKSKFIKKELIYSDHPKYKDDGICKTWEDVQKLFSHPKYNVRWVDSRNNRWYFPQVDDKTVLDEIEERAENGDYITIEIKTHEYNEEYNCIVITKHYKNEGEYVNEIFLINDKGISYIYQRTRDFGNDVIDDLGRFIINIGYDIFDVFNLVDNKYIKKIKSVSSKEDINKILDNAYKSLTREQYSIILSAALCREIELGIWEATYNGETIIQDLTDRFNFEYFTEN